MGRSPVSVLCNLFVQISIARFWSEVPGAATHEPTSLELGPRALETESSWGIPQNQGAERYTKTVARLLATGRPQVDPKRILC